MTPYPYTVSSAADMAKIAECLVRLKISGILVDEALHLMLLTLAKVWATPPGTEAILDKSDVQSRVSLDRDVKFCGESVAQLIQCAVALNVAVPVVFQLACEPHWATLHKQQSIPEQGKSGHEALAALPDALMSGQLHASDALVGCITQALVNCSLPLPFKV
jgi:hypothetical protein